MHSSFYFFWISFLCFSLRAILLAIAHIVVVLFLMYINSLHEYIIYEYYVVTLSMFHLFVFISKRKKKQRKKRNALHLCVRFLLQYVCMYVFFIFYSLPISILSRSFVWVSCNFICVPHIYLFYMQCTMVYTIQYLCTHISFSSTYNARI